MKKQKDANLLITALFLLVVSIESKANVISFCGKNKTKEVVVIGSMHSAKERNQLSKEIVLAIKNSDNLMLEADTSPSGRNNFLDVVDEVDDIKLSSENLASVTKLFKENDSLKLYNILIFKTPSSVISSLLYGVSNLAPDLSLEWGYETISRKVAENSKIHISFFEDARSYLDMWKSIGEKDINAIISSQVEYLSIKENSFDNDGQMYLAWENGDEEQLRNIYLKSYPGEAKNIVKQWHSKREEAMAEQINTAIGKKVFVVVGAYHVNNIRTLLKNYGYKSFDCKF